MAMWSNALLLTDSCLSPLPRCETCLGYVRKLPVTSGEVVVSSTMYNWLVVTKAKKKIEFVSCNGVKKNRVGRSVNKRNFA